MESSCWSGPASHKTAITRRAGAIEIGAGSPTSKAGGMIHRFSGSRLRAAHADQVGHAHELGQRLRTHLAHRIAAVDLHGDLADADFARDLLVHEPGGDVADHLLLARRQLIVAGPHASNRLVTLAP